jgi:putative ABC transport system permease protein
MGTFVQDLRYAVRQLTRFSGFSTTVIVTLALSVGITAAVFSVLYAMLVRPLPYQHVDRIVALETKQFEGYHQSVSYPEYLDYRKMDHSLAELAAYVPWGTSNLENKTGPVALSVVETTDNFFNVFGVRPLMGRTFASGEDQEGRNDVVVLSYEIWQRDFGGSPAVVGEHVKMDGKPFTVIGVMPRQFRFPIWKMNTVYEPIRMYHGRMNRGNHWLNTIALLKPGVTVSTAQAELNGIMMDLGRTDPDNKGRTVKFDSLQSFIVGDTSNSLRLLMYAVLTLLAIGCVNVAGLLLARGVKREREMALRTAIGARRSRVIRQLLTEASLYGLLGGLGGVVLGYGLLRGIKVLLNTALPRGSEVELNVPVLVAALAIAIGVTLVAALAPALRLSGLSPTLALRAGGSAGTTRGQHRLRASFVVTQVALALALLVVSGLLMRMLSSLRHTDLGFNPQRVLSTPLALSRGEYEGRNTMAALYEPLMERVRAIPGVEAVGMIDMLPVQSWGNNWEGLHIQGTPVKPRNEQNVAETRFVSRGFYDAMGIRLVSGRLFDPALDTSKTRLAAVVNEEFVKRIIPPGRDPIGMRIGKEGATETSPDQDDPVVTIVGVVKNVRQSIYQPPMAELDFPVYQVPARFQNEVMSHSNLVVRSRLSADALAPSLRAALHQVDPSLPLGATESVESIVTTVLTLERLENWLFGVFAGMAVLLAIVGLYGLISHEVELSTRDIGVRLALGATREHILKAVYGRVGWMLGGGVVAGLLVTAAARKYIASVVAIKLGHDGAAIAALTLALAVAGLLAAFVPARRASRVEPIVALRDE